MLCRKGPACLSVIGDSAHAEAKTAQVHTQVKELAGVTCAPVSVKQDRTGIEVGIPEELPVGNVIRRIPASRITKIDNASYGIVLDEDVFREPVAVEQMRRCRPHMLVRFEKLGCLINVGPANAVDQGRVGGTVVPRQIRGEAIEIAASLRVNRATPARGNGMNAGKEFARVGGQASHRSLVLHRPQWLTVNGAVNPNGDLYVADRNGIIDQQDLGHWNTHAARLFSGPLFGGEGGRAGDPEDEVVARPRRN